MVVNDYINIYGSAVTEVKVYSKKQRVEAEAFLQEEPVVFSLTDEPDVLRFYMDEETYDALLEGTLEEQKEITEEVVEEMAQAIVEGLGKDLAAALVEYANLVKQLAEDLTSDQVQDTAKIKELLAADLPDWDEEDWEDLRAAVAKRIKENFYFTFGTWKGYPFQDGYIIVKAKDIREAARKFMAKYPNRRDETVLNCSDYYSETQWARILADGCYVDREPLAIME